MLRVDTVGDRTCAALCWIGMLYIFYSHLIA